MRKKWHFLRSLPYFGTIKNITMASNSSEVVILDDDELEDGEIEDDIEEFNEYESLFQSSDNSTEPSRIASKLKHNSRRDNERTSVRNKSHSSRTSNRREKSKSPSASKSHGGLSGRRKTSPVSSKRSHSGSRRRRTSNSDQVAKGLRQKAESRLRRRRRGESPPKPTMRYCIPFISVVWNNYHVTYSAMPICLPTTSEFSKYKRAFPSKHGHDPQK